MAPSTDITNNNDIWADPGLHWGCNRVENNALLVFQNISTTSEIRNNSSSSFTVNNIKSDIASASDKQDVESEKDDNTASGLSPPSYTRFRRFFRKLKHALCEF
ncbi:hypothetical protein C0J52_15045 [Blattella germanica]|nr:hypothetical protein C0J52_15045 [Blattella germanica]